MTMTLLDVVNRAPAPEPWSEGDNIPWNDPDFSRRMLKEHLSQAHDAASRRFAIVDRHLAWIHHHVLAAAPTRILDLGCGPGLYSSRLAQLGHSCLGIDYSPASVTYAAAQAEREGLDCRYIQQDIRTADYGTGYGLAMLIYGELNVFCPADARAILRKAHAALIPGGTLLLEPHPFALVRRIGEQPRSWYTAGAGLFGDDPHLCLSESTWDAGRNTATARYFIVDAASGRVARYAASYQAYTDDEYRALLAGCGFESIVFFPSLTGEQAEPTDDLFVIVGQK